MANIKKYKHTSYTNTSIFYPYTSPALLNFDRQVVDRVSQNHVMKCEPFWIPGKDRELGEKIWQKLVVLVEYVIWILVASGGHVTSRWTELRWVTKHTWKKCQLRNNRNVTLESFLAQALRLTLSEQTTVKNLERYEVGCDLILGTP